MADQIEDLIREIAAKHGIAVSRDDPILVLQTINSRLMLDSSAAHKVQLDHFKEELEAISMRWRTDAKDKADRILNAALSASQEAMRASVMQSAEATSERVRAAMNESLFRVEGAASIANRSALLNLVASFITMLAATIFVLAWFR